ncbi:MAG: toprim domain-containing protein [Azoarcus sp.]|jgi:hypothetical protein|nr:toprim domain-containing protein [Azoarcus sp.]
MILDRILPALTRDYGFKAHGDWLRGGKCPACGKKELYTSRAHPWVLRCPRLNKCGAEFHVKDLYPDLFNDWSKLFPATESNPNAAADAYLRDGRGFDLAKLKQWGIQYAQENYWDKPTNQGSATVRFPVSGDATWERIIDRPHRFGRHKAHFRGNYGGKWWCAPNFGTPKEIWIVEGIFDALALMHHDIDAVATLASTNYPSLPLAALAEQCAAAGVERPRLVWAFDDDPAGHEAMKKHTERAERDGWQVSVALIPSYHGKKIDWNEAHQLGRLEDGNLKYYRYQGELFMARTPMQKALLMYKHDLRSTFYFDFDNRIFWFKLDQEKYAKAKDEAAGNEEAQAKTLEHSVAINEICNCLPYPLYYIKNDTTDEAWYYFRVSFPHDGQDVKNTFTASQLSSVQEFKKRLLHVGAGAIWAGNSGQLDSLLKRWIYGIKTVETIDYIGYSLKHAAYIFNSVAVHHGHIIEANEDDFFQIGKLSIKSLSRIEKMDISTDLKSTSKVWFDRFVDAFGVKGIVALAYWFGTLFAEQIRDRFESYPFLEIVGEPGAGKTTLLETLWKLLGRNSYEGFDPMKASHVGFLRSMAQVSNLPVVLIESDRDSDGDAVRGRAPTLFHWDSLKSLYNGGSLRTTGVKSAGNDTYDPQFRAALVISQNAPVSASMPIMERIVQLSFDKSHQTEVGRDAALELGRMAASEVSNFLLRAAMKEEKVLSLIEEHAREYEKTLEAAGCVNQRIQKNYAQIMILVSCLELVTPITREQRAEALSLLRTLALARERELMRDHIIVERFWEIYDYLNGVPEDDDGNSDIYLPKLNHSRDAGLIAVNLNHFAEIAREHNQPIPDLYDLKKYLHTSRQRKFVGSNVVVSSAINARYNTERSSNAAPKPSSIRCWVFKARQ